MNGGPRLAVLTRDAGFDTRVVGFEAYVSRLVSLHHRLSPPDWAPSTDEWDGFSVAFKGN